MLGVATDRATARSVGTRRRRAKRGVSAALIRAPLTASSTGVPHNDALLLSGLSRRATLLAPLADGVLLEALRQSASFRQRYQWIYAVSEYEWRRTD